MDQKIGARFAVSDVIVYETGQEDNESIRYRWKNYGRSDHEVYSSHRNTWSVGENSGALPIH